MRSVNFRKDLGALIADLGCFPLDKGSFHPMSDYCQNRLRSCIGFAEGALHSSRCLSVLYPGFQSIVLRQRSANTDFAENQLSPSSVSFSLLSAAHPVLLQQQWVRPLGPALLGQITWRTPLQTRLHQRFLKTLVLEFSIFIWLQPHQLFALSKKATLFGALEQSDRLTTDS